MQIDGKKSFRASTLFWLILVLLKNPNTFHYT